MSTRLAPFARYLDSRVPGRRFAVARFATDAELMGAIERKEVDFVLSTPAILMELELKFGARPIVTALHSAGPGTPAGSSWLASAVFVRRDRTDIREMADANGRRVTALRRSAMGGWLAALREWREIGIDETHGLRGVQFLSDFAGIVDRVCSGATDIGVLPASVLPTLRGRCPEGIRVLPAPVHGKVAQVRAVPFEVSTRTYPEGGFAAVADVDDSTATAISMALLSLPADSEAARGDNVRGFVPALSYAPVQELMQELRIGPYESYGKLTFAQAAAQHADKVAAVLAVFLFMLGSAFLRLRRLNRRLAESERRLREFFDGSGDAIFVTDLAGRFLEVNAAACRRLGYTREELLRLDMNAIRPKRETIDTAAAIERLPEDGPHIYETYHQRRDGSLFPVEVSACRLSYGATEAVLKVVRDVTERKRVEEALRVNQERLTLALEATSDSVWEWDPSSDQTWCSPNWYTTLGYEPHQWAATVGTWELLTHPDDIDPVRQLIARAVADDGVFEAEFRMRAADGSWRWIRALGRVSRRDADGRPTRMSGTNTDITERKRAEEERIRLREQLEQAGKMESLGRMAGGMAHDFNNLLTVINGYSDRLETQLGGGDASLLAAARAIGAAGRQGVGLIRQLLAFSRKQAIELRPLNLNEVVSANREMLQRLLDEDIELEIRLETGLGLAMADSCQLLQILMNLAVNARDAMQGRGVLTIGTANEESADGAQVTLTVADTGKGIPEWALGAIFDPFFTTKDEGAGTGLGLSMVYGIVKQFGGGITTESSPGTGTSFRIALPRIALPAAPQAESPEDAPTPATAQGEPAPTAPHETILVVEDRGEVRQLAGVLLQSHGYRVLEAIGGEEALDMARHYDGNIHLLLTDVVMPRMSGDELARRFSRLRPDTAVLYMSGFSELFWLDAGPAPADERVCVQKPFTDDQLASAVRGALKAGKAEHGPIKKEPPRILLAEDSAGIRALLTELLEEHGYSVVAAGNAAGALREARCGRFALAVTDLNLPDDSGIGLARSLRAELPGIQIIVMSALLDEATRARALLEGANAAIDKTCAVEVLPVEVERILACAGVPV